MKYTNKDINRILRIREFVETSNTLSKVYLDFDNKEYTLLNLIGDRLYSRIYTGSTHYFLSECDKRSWPKVGF